MLQLKWILFTFSFLIIHLDAKTCTKGQRLQRGVCVACPNEYFQPEDNNSNRCQQCMRCDNDSGSFVQTPCSKVANTKCQCRTGFVHSDSDFSTCKCDKGSGKTNGACSKCEAGYFNNRIDSPCQKWKRCSSGVKVPGTSTSDVICDESKSDVSTIATSNKTEPPFTDSTTKPSHEGDKTQRKDTTNSPIITSTSGNDVTPWQRVDPTGLPGYIGVALLIFVIALLMLTAVICKLYINPRQERKPAEQTRDSLCRRPVEESGDGDDSQTPLKQCPGEP